MLDEKSLVEENINAKSVNWQAYFAYLVWFMEEVHGTTRLATAISPPAEVHGKQLHHELRHAVALSGIWLTRLGKTITEERTVAFFFPWQQQQRSPFFFLGNQGPTPFAETGTLARRISLTQP